MDDTISEGEAGPTLTPDTRFQNQLGLICERDSSLYGCQPVSFGQSVGSETRSSAVTYNNVKCQERVHIDDL